MNKTAWIIIAFLLGLLIIQRECSRCPEAPEPSVSVDTVYVYKERIIKDVVIKTEFRDTTIFIEIPQKVDTDEILRDYFALRLYNDTLVKTEDLTIFANIGVQNNKLKHISTAYEFKQKETIIEITKEVEKEVCKNRFKLFVGANLTRFPDNRLEFGPSLIVNTKRDGLYGYTYGVLNNSHSISMYYKLKFR